MLSKERVNEAKENVSQYLKEGMLKKITEKEFSVRKILINNCDDSLTVAEHLSKNNMSNLWIIVCSYYSMYYIANAVLYSLGFKVQDKISHKVTADALIVYVTKRLKESFLEDYEEAKSDALEISGNKAESLVEHFDFEREKRSRFQYSTSETALKSKAQTSLERAKRFVFEMKKLLI
jgi:hypothetical protein